jgi:hypothetical protein
MLNTAYSTIVFSLPAYGLAGICSANQKKQSGRINVEYFVWGYRFSFVRLQNLSDFTAVLQTAADICSVVR